MTITTSLMRNTTHIRKANTPIAIAKLQALESLSKHTSFGPLINPLSARQPKTIMEKSYRRNEYYYIKHN